MSSAALIFAQALTKRKIAPYDCAHWRRYAVFGDWVMQVSFGSIAIIAVSGLVLTGLPVGSCVR